jgi:3-oxoacyl-[acyl-carrier-protein] synthase II
MRERDVRQRVVITGMGALTPLGLSVDETWAGLVAGRSGVAKITRFDPGDLPVRIAGEVKGFDPTDYIDSEQARHMARCSQLALAAGIQAMADAGLADQVPESERAGVVVGTANGGMDIGLQGWDTYKAKGPEGLDPSTTMASLCNMPAHHLSLRFRCQAYNSTVVTACASGTQAVGQAAEVIRRGAAELMLAGGVEGMIHPSYFAALFALRVLATDNEHPEQAIKPFDSRRDGFVIVQPYAEVLGFAANSDAHHAASPDPVGAGAARCMRWALENAGVSPPQVDYINAHGPATVVGDPIETKAIKTIFGEHAYRVPVSSIKSMIGHASGGAGAIEAMACVQSIVDGILPPTINLEVPDPECDLDYVPQVARKANVRTVLSNSFGLGGQNACLVLCCFEG